MLMSSRCFRLCFLAILLAAPAALRAQVTGSIGLLAGYYRPYGHFDPASIYDTGLPGQPSDLRGVLKGVAGQLTFGRRFGVEAQLTTAGSTIPVANTPAGPRGPTNVSVDMATLEGEYDVSPTPQRYQVWLEAGPALVRHGSDAYAPYHDPTSVGGALGIGLTVPLGPHFQIATNLNTVWYTFDLGMPAEDQRNPGPLEHGPQRDALLQVGLRWGHL
jgi:hypothetical protein